MIEINVEIPSISELNIISINDIISFIKNLKLYNSSGIYFLFDKNKNILYIGKAKSLGLRISEHLNYIHCSKNYNNPLSYSYEGSLHIFSTGYMKRYFTSSIKPNEIVQVESISIYPCENRAVIEMVSIMHYSPQFNKDGRRYGR